MANGPMQRTFQTKSKIVSGTSDVNGNLYLQLTSSEADMILSVTNNNLVFIPFIYAGKWYARAQSSGADGAAIINTTMNVTVIYH